MGAIEDFREALAVRRDAAKIPVRSRDEIRAQVAQALSAQPVNAPRVTPYQAFVAPFRARDVAAIEARMAAPDPVRMTAKPRDELGRLARAQAERDRAARTERERKEAERIERERALWAKEDAARERWQNSPERRALERAACSDEIVMRTTAHRWLPDGTTYCGADVPNAWPMPGHAVRLKTHKNAWSCPDCRMLAGER